MDLARAPLAVKATTAAGAVVVAAAGAWALRTFDPNVAGNPFLPCIFNKLTGLYCPDCGGTRCLHALVHGDLAGALAMNPLIVMLAVIAPFFVAWTLGWRPRALHGAARALGTPMAWLVGLVAFGVLRNLPWMPFSWLAPG